MVTSLLRLARAGYVLAREGALAIVDPAELPPGAAFAIRLARKLERRGVAAESRAERLSAALNRLGPSWIKLGQFLATRQDIVGPTLAEQLGRLRDEIDPFPEAEARAIVAAAFGRPVEAVYTSFSAPVAAASIAQVHKAEIVSDGGTRTVAVKVLRPRVRARFARDLRSFYTGARFVERFDPRMKRLRPIAVVDTLARSVMMEMDLRLEAAALSEMTETTEGDAGFRVPKIDWERTARDVLTLEWIDGIKLSDIAALDAAGFDRAEIATRVMQIFLRQAIRDGFFHADMHQGNLFIDAVGNVVAVDFGIMGRLSVAERHFLAEILYGFIRRDYRRVAQVHFDAGYVPARHSVEDFAQALRAIGEPIHDRPARDISMARLLSLLFEVTDLFDMATRPELLLLQKTMVVVEGVCRSLDPDFDMWVASEPVVRQWIERNVGPAAVLESAAAGFGELGRLAAELPRLAERARRLSSAFDRMAEGGVSLDDETIAAINQAGVKSERWGFGALWVLALAAVGGVIWLFTS